MSLYADGIYLGEYGSILEYVKDAGYQTIEDAAEVLGLTVKEFTKDLTIGEES